MAGKNSLLNFIMGECIEMNTNKFRVMYVSDIPSIFFKKGEIYEAFLPLDNRSGNVYAFHIEDIDEPGDYALPASRFRIIEKM